MKLKTCIVIGAGIGGICTAIHLVKKGMHVTIVEKNAHPGGRCDHFSRDGHTFDIGPTLLIMRKLYEEEFAELGVSMDEILDLQRVDPTYHLYFDDGSQLELTSDMKSMQQQLETFEPGSFQGFTRYMKEGGRHYYFGMKKLVRRDFRRITDFFSISNAPLLFQVKPLVNHYRNMSTYFKDERLKEAFTFQDMYMGLSPFEAPATYSFMSYTELEHGVWYPRGGMYSIALALAKLAEQVGVEFIYNANVEQIEIIGGMAQGVRLESGEHLKADIIVANADLPYVYQNLLPSDGMVKKLAKKHYSCSVLSFFWGLDKPFPSIPPHALFLSEDYQGTFESIINDLGMPANPSVYFHAPTRLEPSMAPEGQDTLISVVPIGHLSGDNDQDWETLQNLARTKIFNKARRFGITDLQDHIKFETVFTPLTWQRRYNLVKGSTHGLSHHLTQMAYFRPSNRHAHISNLYFVGASTRPGTGLPTAMVSGRLTAQRIVEELSN